MHCVGGQPLVSVLFVAVLITLFFLKTFSLLVCTLFYIRYKMKLIGKFMLYTYEMRIRSSSSPRSGLDELLMRISIRNSLSYVISTTLCKTTLSTCPCGVMVGLKIRTQWFESVHSVFSTCFVLPSIPFFTQKHVLTSKRNSLVLFIEQYLHP